MNLRGNIPYTDRFKGRAQKVGGMDATDLRTVRVEFEWDADDGFYKHKHAFDISEAEQSANELAGALEGKAAQIESMLRQRLMQAGIAGAEPDFDITIIDEDTVGVEQTISAPTNTDSDSFFVSSVTGEMAQLLSMTAMVNPEQAVATMEHLEQIAQALQVAEPAEQEVVPDDED